MKTAFLTILGSLLGSYLAGIALKKMNEPWGQPATCPPCPPTK